MARPTTDMTLNFYGSALVSVTCKIQNMGCVINTTKNATLIFYGCAAVDVNKSEIKYQIL